MIDGAGAARGLVARIRHLASPRAAYGLVALLVVALLLDACAAPLNYTRIDGPRYTGCGPDSVSWDPRTGERVGGGSAWAPPFSRDSLSAVDLRIVSFNIKFSVHIDRAIALLQSDPDLREADVILLQEMDEPGVRSIAAKLDYCWVYYPATFHPQTERQFGDAILSRYPIIEDHKVLLPHFAQLRGTQRIATAATLDVAGEKLRVYSVHLATVVELGPGRRADQARAIVDDASRFAGPVIIAGDLNSHDVGEVFAAAGYDWITRDVGRTTGLASLDHFFLRGFEPAQVKDVGKSASSQGASDHVPIWTVLRIRPGTGA